MPAPTLPEQAAQGAALIVEEYRRTGTLPPAVLRRIQASALRRGEFLPLDAVEREARAWFERLLAAVDAGGDPEEVD